MLTRLRRCAGRSLEAHLERCHKRALWADTAFHSLASALLTSVVVVTLVASIYLPHVVSLPFNVDEIVSFLVLGIAAHSLGVLGHETYHDSFFRSKNTNKILGAWLFHYPLLGRFHALKEIHLRHHRFFGTEADPDRDHWGFSPRSNEHRVHLFRTALGLTFVQSVLNVMTSST